MRTLTFDASLLISFLSFYFQKHVRQDAAEASPMIISVNLKHLATSVEIVDEFPNSNQLIEVRNIHSDTGFTDVL